MLVFRIQCTFFIVLLIPQKTCRSNGFFFFTGQNVREKSGASLRAFARQIAPDPYRLTICPSSRTSTIRVPPIDHQWRCDRQLSTYDPGFVGRTPFN